jgi:hypothetical protein
MPDTDTDTEPIPPIAPTIGRLHWHVDHIRREPDRYDSRQLASLRGAAMELAEIADRELMARAKL